MCVLPFFPLRCCKKHPAAAAAAAGLKPQNGGSNSSSSSRKICWEECGLALVVESELLVESGMAIRVWADRGFGFATLVLLLVVTRSLLSVVNGATDAQDGTTVCLLTPHLFSSASHPPSPVPNPHILSFAKSHSISITGLVKTILRDLILKFQQNHSSSNTRIHSDSHLHHAPKFLHKTQDSVCVFLLLSSCQNSSYTVKFWLFLMILKNVRPGFSFIPRPCVLLLQLPLQHHHLLLLLASGNMNCDLSCCWKTHAEALFCFFFFYLCTIPVT